MRIGLIGATLCLCLVGISHAQSAKAAIRKDLNVPAEELGSALQTVAKDYDFQVLYRTEIVKDLSTQGAVGSLTSDEALRKVLNGTGLSYKYLDANTVTVFSSSPSGTPAAAGQNAASGSSDDASTKGGGKKSSQDFRVAQVDQGKNSSTASVGGQALSPHGNDNSPSVGLEEIIVTAQKREENLEKVPISIAVLNGKDLDRSTFSGATDALNTVPGVAATPSYFGGGTQVAVRGVAGGSPVAGGSSPIAYYIDSVPFGFVRTALVPDENVFDLQRVEVLRGPQGTLYGASALNGVVRILTHDVDLSEFDFKVRASDSYTESGGNNYRSDVAVNIPVVPGILAVRAVVGYENDSGWIDTPVENHVNDAELRNYRVKIRAQPTDEASIELSAWSTRNNYGAAPSGDKEKFNTSVLNIPVTTDWDAYGLRLAYQFPSFSVSTASSYLDYDNVSYLDALPLLHFPFEVASDLHSNVFSQEVYLTSTNDGAWRWTAGGMYRHAVDSLWQANTINQTPFPAIYTTLTSDSKAVFGELTRLFLDGRVELTAGLRHFYDNGSQDYIPTPTTPAVSASSTSQANTPRAVLAWHPVDHATIYTSFSKGFRSGFPQDGGVNLPPPKPDKLTNYEVGAKGSLFDGLFSYDTAVYHMDWKDVQQTITVLLNGVPNAAVLNGSSASGSGVDLSLTAQPVKNLTLGLGYSWNNLEFDSTVISAGGVLFHKGDRPDFSPETTASLSAGYLVALGSGGLQGQFLASGNYTSKQTYHLAGATAGIGVGDDMFIARASFAISAPEHWRTTLFVDNLTNENGSPVVPPYPFRNWDVRIRPRTFGVQFDYRYK
jgi:iron complex outermembrane receptor protein